MIRFLISYITVYSLMNGLFYFRVRVLLPERGPYHFLMMAFLAFMVFAPMGARIFERSDHYVLARVIAFAGYPWMGFLFYAFFCSLFVGMAGALFKLINFFAGASLPAFSGKKAALAVLALALAINIYGFFEAGSLRVERVSIKTAKLPPGVDHIRIAQVSDIHLGLLVGGERLRSILEKVGADNPDILVNTGDLVDGDMDRIGNLPALFSTVKPRWGKYAITGNHEIYVGVAKSEQAVRDFGFTLLRNDVVKVGNAVNVVGVDDPAAATAVDEKALLTRASNGLFTLLLKHRPDPDPDSLGLFDLQLSGHTHYGQLFPFRLFSQIFYPLQNGPYFLEKGSILYTSRGTATWGPPIRVLAPPEITIIDIVRE